MLNYKKDGTKFWNELHCCPGRKSYPIVGLVSRESLVITITESGTARVAVKNKDTGAISFIVGVQQEVDENGQPLVCSIVTSCTRYVATCVEQIRQSCRMIRVWLEHGLLAGY